jgi:predicted helicase
MRYFTERFASQRQAAAFDDRIKWSRNLKRRFEQKRLEVFDETRIVSAAYRPFVKRFLYDSNLFIDEGGAKDQLFPIDQPNLAICFSDVGSRTDYCVLAVSGLADLHFGAAIDAFQQVPLNRYSDSGVAQNITNWSLDQFRKHYQPGRGKKDRPITKEAIFHYVYGVLHDPVYREKYALNLKREFPRIPFYADFWHWADWGQRLMDLHIGYESVAPWELSRTDVPDEKARRAGLPPKARLKADKETGLIRLDSETVLAGIPPEAWYYRLGNRSALEWVLDQYKEKTPKDPTIREKFNTYRFADYKDKVIDLLARVTTVSVETMKIVEAMRRASR